MVTPPWQTWCSAAHSKLDFGSGLFAEPSRAQLLVQHTSEDVWFFVFYARTDHYSGQTAQPSTG